MLIRNLDRFWIPWPPIGGTTATSTIGQERRSSGGQRVPSRTWVGPTTNWSQPDTFVKSKALTPWRFVIVKPSHSWWWPFRAPTNTKESRSFPACTAAIVVSKQPQIQSSMSRLRDSCRNEWATERKINELQGYVAYDYACNIECPFIDAVGSLKYYTSFFLTVYELNRDNPVPNCPNSYAPLHAGRLASSETVYWTVHMTRMLFSRDKHKVGGDCIPNQNTHSKIHLQYIFMSCT